MNDKENNNDGVIIPDRSKDEPGKKWAERPLPPVATPEDDGLGQHARNRQEFLAQSGGEHINDEKIKLKEGWELNRPEDVLQGTDLNTSFDEPDQSRDRISDTSPFTDSDDTSYEQSDNRNNVTNSAQGWHLTGDMLDR